MDKLLTHVRIARRRLSWQMFLGYAGWTLLATLTLAAVAVGAHTRFPSRIEPWLANAGALAVGVALGLLAAAIWTWRTRPSLLSAAVEIDRRFELRERISSSLALSPEEQRSAAGRALLDDALSRAQRIDVRSEFGVPLRRRLLLPIVPLFAALLLAVVVQAREVAPSADPAADLAERQQTKDSTDDLRSAIDARQKEASEKGLKDAEDTLKEIQQELRKMEERGDQGRAQSLVDLNKLGDKVAQRRQQLEGAEQVREQLRNLKDVPQGPADKLAQALKQGNLGQAAAELEKLQQQAAEGKLDQKQQEQLAEQLAKLQQKLANQAATRDRKIHDLKQQIDQAKQQQDQAAADKLQQQLDQLQQQQQGELAQRMEKMAQKLEQASQCMKQGQCKEGAKALADLAQDMRELQRDNDQLQTLDQAMEDIQLAKDQVGCKACQGSGCQQCQGQKQGLGAPQPGGKPGEGHIAAEGDGQEKAAGHFDTKVRQTVGKGAAVVVGQADGPNAKGRVEAAIRAEFESRQTGPADPLTNQRMHKSQREHVESYFKAMREGKGE